jgi:Na+/proline symporter
LYVAVVSVFYMFMFISAELTAIGAVVSLPAFGGANATLAIIATAVVTVAYTSWGGLPASLRTDRWQGWLVLGLLAIAAVALVFDVDQPATAANDGGLSTINQAGFEAIIVLSIAIGAANLFHQGYWQRTWSADRTETVGKASMFAAALTFPVVLVVGLIGLVAAGTGSTPPFEGGVPLFDLMADLPVGIRFGAVVLAVALVASSVDSLQNGMTAVVAQDVADRSMTLNAARIATVALTVPAVVIAVQGYDILRLFLIADLVAAATVGPVFLGLTRLVNSNGALAGSVAGLVAVFVHGSVRGGDLAAGWDYLTLANSPPLPIGAFLWAPIASIAVALLVSRLGGADGSAETQPVAEAAAG